MTRNEYVSYRMNRAMQSLLVAETLYEKQFFEDAVNRIYYAVFYAASALLYQYKFYPKTHSGVKSLFNREFVKTGLINKNIENIFSAIFAKRFEADYEDFFEMDINKMEKYLADAKFFIETVETILNNNSND